MIYLGRFLVGLRLGHCRCIVPVVCLLFFNSLSVAQESSVVLESTELEGAELEAVELSKDRDAKAEALAQRVNSLDHPMFKPFIERYVLDELKQLRVELAQLRVETTREITDRHISVSSRAIGYVADATTYFFYLIAGVSSVLVVVGWTSFREIKEKVSGVADQEISKLVSHYEQRLSQIEQQVSDKAEHIAQNKSEIVRSQEVQALWLRAGIETQAANKIVIYDQILHIDPRNVEALAYKADAILQLNEPQWAASLCRQALQIDPENSNAFYQLACACSEMGSLAEALECLQQAIDRGEAYREMASQDPAMSALASYPGFFELVNNQKEDEDV